MTSQGYSHLSGPDYVMLGGYFVIMLGIGLYFYRHMRGMKDYFTGANKIPWWLSGVSFYMTSFSVAAFVFYPSLCYRHGWVGVTLLWVAVPAALFSAGLFAARWRRARIDSPVEYLETRYGPVLRQLFAWQGVPVKIIDDGIKLYATGKFISICAGIPINYSILGAGGVMLLYTFMGGVWAVSVTDFVQFVVLAAGLLIVLPLSISKAGGLSNIFENSPDGFFNLTSPEFGWSYVIPLVLLYSLAWSSINWSLIQRYYCVPNEKDARKVGGLVVALYIIGPPMMFFPAIAARQFIPTLADAGDIYPTLCAQLLPAGMLGLALAAMFSATMSTLSGDYNVCASVLTNDVYRRLIRPRASERELVTVGRAMTLIIGVIGLGAAFLMARGKAEDLFRIMVTLFGIATAPVAIPMLLGLLSRKMTNTGAVLGFLAGIGVGLGLFFLSRINREVVFMGVAWHPKASELVIGGFAIKMEIVMFLGTALVTFTVMAAASLLKPMASADRGRVEAFMKRLEAPIGALEEDKAAMAHAGSIMSPFRVVGFCIVAIGLLMLGVLPWVKDPMAFWLDAVLGLALMAAGFVGIGRGYWKTLPKG
ncbi:MAG TPA: sodium/solute symporter [Candidatus Hydrogenedentes bacterium]|nr:sodium/solute symporter [Candidatus Hydrogenedentota bacterium]HOV75711.1 sodium/solute symporter [Candidatus Hydrogenedentota bacterium]